MCKAFSLDDFFASLRRALPYANMSCPFRAFVALFYAHVTIWRRHHVLSHKAESLPHTSVGQRPTYKRIMYLRLKALNILDWVTIRYTIMCKAFSLDAFFASLRRALPYANMSCPFRAFVALPYASRCRGFVLIVCAVQMMVE